MNIDLSMFWLFVAYVLIPLVGIVHTVFNWKVLDMESPAGTKPSKV